MKNRKKRPVTKGLALIRKRINTVFRSLKSFLSPTPLLREIVLLVFCGCFFSLVVFFSLTFILNPMINDFFIESDYITKKEEPYLADLQKYVLLNNVSTEDFFSLRDWADDKKVRRLTISRGNTLLYDSVFSDSKITQFAISEYLNYHWQYMNTVTFSDGNAEVYIEKDYALPFYIALYTGIGLVSVSVWIAILIYGIRKKVFYLNEIRRGIWRIESGDLTSEIVRKGSDEISELADGINQMRISLLEKTLSEEKIRKSHSELVTGMAHDLRTPLTALTTYMEIADMQEDPDETKKFISKAIGKALQIRDLTDRLFDVSLEDPLLKATKDNNEKGDTNLLPLENAEYALGEYLSELCALLEAGGFTYTARELSWEPVGIRISLDYMGRIVDNINTNIRKYADPAFPIKISSTYENHLVHISIVNRNRPKAYKEMDTGTSKGIGLNNIKKMMLKMRGYCLTKMDENTFEIVLSFPTAGISTYIQ